MCNTESRYNNKRHETAIRFVEMITLAPCINPQNIKPARYLFITRYDVLYPEHMEILSCVIGW